MLHGNRVAVLRHEVSKTFVPGGIIERSDSQKYELAQGNIVALGWDVESSDLFYIGKIASFNRFLNNQFEITMPDGGTVVVDTLHVTDVFWSEPE